MGRPLNKKYFANVNYQDFGTANVGGESVASVPNATGLTGMTYLTGGPYTILAADIGAPQVDGGVKPVLTFQPTSATAGTITVVSPGSGYTAAPTITVRGSLAAGSGTANKTAVLTSSRFNGILVETQFGSGDAEILTGDIIKQVSGRRYKVQTSQGNGIFKLVPTEAKGALEMSMMATDSDGGTYLVSKLTARKAVLVPVENAHAGTSTAGAQFASGTAAKWTFGAAVAGTTVTISNQ
jgi:hypothetical protein